MATVISLGGLAWTQSREGTVLKPYYDSVKVATIGTGTTVYPNGKAVKITDPPITKKQAAEYQEKNRRAREHGNFRGRIPMQTRDEDFLHRRPHHRRHAISDI